MKPAAFSIFFMLWTGLSLTGLAQEMLASATKQKWYLPDQMVVQFAGNLGLLAVGPSYSLANNKINLDVLYGLTPNFEANAAIHTVTGKFTYSPWRRKLTSSYTWEPFKFGMGISYTFGSHFYTVLPDYYPDKYYFWQTRFRLIPFISSSINKTLEHHYTLIKQVQGYGEIGTHDLAILSIATNKTLNPWNIISFALGARFIF